VELHIEWLVLNLQNFNYNHTLSSHRHSTIVRWFQPADRFANPCWWPHL